MPEITTEAVEAAEPVIEYICEASELIPFLIEIQTCLQYLLSFLIFFVLVLLLVYIYKFFKIFF